MSLLGKAEKPMQLLSCPNTLLLQPCLLWGVSRAPSSLPRVPLPAWGTPWHMHQTCSAALCMQSAFTEESGAAFPSLSEFFSWSNKKLKYKNRSPLKGSFMLACAVCPFPFSTQSLREWAIWMWSLCHPRCAQVIQCCKSIKKGKQKLQKSAFFLGWHVWGKLWVLISDAWLVHLSLPHHMTEF